MTRTYYRCFDGLFVQMPDQLEWLASDAMGIPRERLHRAATGELDMPFRDVGLRGDETPRTEDVSFNSAFSPARGPKAWSVPAA